MAELIKPMDTILRAIREERTFRQDFSVAADKIVDKVYSFYTNANCTCKGAIIDWVNNNVDTTNTLIQKNLAAIDAMTADAAKAVEVAKVAAPTNAPPAPPSPANMLSNPKAKFGTVLDIERDPEAFSKLIKGGMNEGWIYRGLTVVPDIVDGKAVWTLFFY